jgi:hypothetical protein
MFDDVPETLPLIVFENVAVPEKISFDVIVEGRPTTVAPVVGETVICPVVPETEDTAPPPPPEAVEEITPLPFIVILVPSILTPPSVDVLAVGREYAEV